MKWGAHWKQEETPTEEEGVATTLFSSAWNSCELSEAKATAWAVWGHHCPCWVKQFYSQRTPTFVKCIANILWLPKFLMCQKCTKIQKITYVSILISHYLIFTHDSKGAVIVCEKGLEISHIAVVSTPGELLWPLPSTDLPWATVFQMKTRISLFKQHLESYTG